MTTITPTAAQEDSFKKETLGKFSGDVYFHHLHKDQHVSILNVKFSPCARTDWHWHEKGQLLEVTTGSGWVCDKGEEPRRIKAGDIVWCPPGVTHWHGSDDGNLMIHRAVSFGGMEWYDPVSAEDLKGTH